MKTLWLVSTMVLAAALLAAAAGSAPATYIDHEKADKGGTLVTAPEYRVQVLSRKAAGQVEVHEKETDIFYVMEGEATFITGGTVVNGKVSRPDQILGTDIQGGEVHHLAKGDVIVIPAGTPHWFKEIPQSIKYFTVKSIKP